MGPGGIQSLVHPQPQGVKALEWFRSTICSISFSPMPPTRETVLVKYSSTTALSMPMASKIWADW